MLARNSPLAWLAASAASFAAASCTFGEQVHRALGDFLLQALPVTLQLHVPAFDLFEHEIETIHQLPPLVAAGIVGPYGIVSRLRDHTGGVQQIKDGAGENPL